MKMEQLAQLLEGLNAGLVGMLGKKESEQLKTFGALLRQWQERDLGQFVDLVSMVEAELTKTGKTPKEFQKHIATLLSQQGAGVDELIAKIKAGEPANPLLAKAKLKLPDIKKLVEGLGIKPARTLAENKRLVEEFRQQPQQPATSPVLVEEAFTAFTSIQGRLKNLSFEDIRSEFQKLERFDSRVLQEVANRLGYTSINGSHHELLEILERQKRSLVQTGMM